MLKNISFKIISFEEGFKSKPYYCSENFPTVGIGRRIGNKGEALPNLTVSLSDEEGLLHRWIDSATSTIQKYPSIYSAWQKMNDARKAVLLSMIYQLGINGTINFKKFLVASANSDWNSAHAEMLDSKAARQTPNRFKRQSKVMLTGSIEGIYN